MTGFACSTCGRLLNWLLAVVFLAAAPAAFAAAPQRTFDSAQSAVDALIAAVRADDPAAVLAILGQDAKSSVVSQDRVADRDRAARFVAAYEAKHALAAEGDNRATLTLGTDDWPFAFPLVRSGAQWRFDTAAGRRELLARRIGENELSTINVLLAIVDAQREYATEDRDVDGVREYARRFASREGHKDGLYWPTGANETPSPLGPLVTRAASEGYRKAADGAPPAAYHGYHFRMLRGQGPHAKGGALDYEVRGRMIGGFAVVAWPATWRSSGVMTFIVNHDGEVYEKDLGPDTAKSAAAITRFDPGPGWKPVRRD